MDFLLHRQAGQSVKDCSIEQSSNIQTGKAGRPASPEVDDAKVWLNQKRIHSEIIDDLVKKYGDTLWKNLDLKTKEERAKTALDSAKRYFRDKKSKKKVKRKLKL